MKPEYNIKAGSLTLDSAQITSAGLLVDIQADLGLGRVNTARITVPSPVLPAAGDPVVIGLGAGGTQQVFSGLVAEIRRGIRECTIYCESRAAGLVNTRLNKLYAQQTAGAIVGDFAGLLGIATGTVEDGIEFPVYAVDDKRHLLEHMLDMGRCNGFDCYADVDDNLVFAPYAPAASHSFQYGVNILALSLEERPGHISGVEVYGASPSSLGQGTEAASWLTKQEIKGTAGTGSSLLRLVDPVLKDPDSAAKAAESILAEFAKKHTGCVKVPGCPEAKLGDSLELKDLPDSGMNRTGKITGIRHRLNKTLGFITVIAFTEE